MDMKTFKQHLAKNQKINLQEQVAVTADKVVPDALKAVEKLQKELEKILGKEYVVKAVFSKNLGKSIHLMIHDVDPPNRIADNSPVHMKLMMYLSTNFGKDADLPKVSWDLSTAHYMQRRAGIKFRKITSKKSIDDATNKLIGWFKKNKNGLDKLLKDGEK